MHDIKMFRQKRLVKKSKFVRRKNPPEHKYFVTFVTKVGPKYIYILSSDFPIKWGINKHVMFFLIQIIFHKNILR